MKSNGRTIYKLLNKREITSIIAGGSLLISETRQIIIKSTRGVCCGVFLYLQFSETKCLHWKNKRDRDDPNLAAYSKRET